MSLDFDTQPYFDDSVQNEIPNNYVRVLFKPNYAVQARELTALQTILQNQITSLGSYVFADGSPVMGGHISLDTTVISIALNQQFANVDINLNDFYVGGEPTLITDSATQTVKAVVMQIDPSQANPTILVKYLTSVQFQPGQTIQVAQGVETQATLVSANASNPGSVASIAQGIFYSGGFFINVQPQTVVVDSTTNQPNARIGLAISENIINSTDDATLLDPALGSSNYEAPGADRYQYQLTLATRSFTSTDDSAFYDLLEVQNGLITKQIDYPVFGDLDAALAQRTYDTSGNFTVRPFGITTTANTSNTSNYDIIVSPGKAYVRGFEFGTISTQRLSVPRALQTNTVNTYSFTTEFGNYVVVNNLQSGNTSGFFNVGEFANLDLHCVSTANINTTNSVTYTATKIGVARIRDVEFLGLGQYYAYITDVSIVSNNFIAVAGSSNTITLPTNIGQLGGNAFANVLITVNTGGVVDTRTISSYSNTSRVASLSTPLTVPATSASNCTLDFSIVNLDSLVVAPSAFGGNSYYMQNTSTPYLASMDVSVGGKNVTGNTILNDTQFNCLIFTLPQNYIAQNTINNATFYHRKNLFSQTITSGNLTISSGSGLGTGESFPYGYSNQYLSDAAANTYFLCTIRNSVGSNTANGTVINWDRNSNPGGNGIYQTDTGHVTVVLNTSGSPIADLLFTVQVTNAAQQSVARRTKTFYGNSNNTVLKSTDSYLNGEVVIGTTNTNSVWVDTTNAFVWFTSNPDIPTTPGSRLGMSIPDVISIIKIYDSGNPAYMPNTTNAIDITTHYALDSGQRDNYYNHASLLLIPGNNPPAGQVVVMLTGYQHDSVSGFFDCDSYAASIYNTEQIPYFNSTKFGTFTLRDCIDFRPTRIPGYTSNIQTFSLTGLDLPAPDYAFSLGYQFYLPRIDKFTISETKCFQVIQGVPNVYPVPPPDSNTAMTAYVLSIPAFTANISAIGLQYISNKRYTMKDIGALDTRIQQLEYYSALSQLEAQAVNEKILYQDGVTAKDTYGIIADDFGAYSIADVSSPDLQCYMEPGSLGPMKAQWPLSFRVSSSNNVYNEGGVCYCMDFTEVPALQQNAASTFMSVQPYLFGQFQGTMVLTPSTDSYYSANLIPQITTPSPVLPAVVPPPAAPTMPVIINEPVACTSVTSSYIQIEAYNGYIGIVGEQNPFWTGDPVFTPFVYSPTLAAFGGINLLTNWFGVPIANATASAANAQPTQLGSSIALNPGGTLTQVGAKSTSVVVGTGFNII